MLVALVGVGAIRSASAGSLLETLNSEVSEVYDQSKAAIIKVHAQRLLQLNNLPLIPQLSVGTGFFIDAEGRFLTANSVVQDAESCWITWGDKKVPAKILGRDQQTNLALLKVDPEKCVGAGKPMPFLKQGNSDELRVGSLVIAIGFPYDMPSAPVVGFINGLDIRSGARVFATSHLRAGCKLSPGQGGGPLLNVHGEVVGIAVAAHMDDQCYALPINATKKICADLMESGQVCHGWVGVGIGEQEAPVDGGVSNVWQVYVQQVFPNTPAADAGLRDRDVLLQIYTNDVRRTSDVLNTIFAFRSGDRVTFTIQREGKKQQVSLVVGDRPPQTAWAGYQQFQQVNVFGPGRVRIQPANAVVGEPFE